MTLVTLDVTSSAPELAVYIVVFLAFLINYLKKLKNRITTVKFYVSSLKWPFITNDNDLKYYSTFYKVLSIIMLSTPFIAFLCWIAIVIFKAIEGKNGPITPLSIGLVTIFIFLILVGRFKLEWSYFEESKSTTAMLISGLGTFITYQLVVNFMEKPYSYFGLSSIFLFYDCLCIFALIAIYDNHRRISFIQHLQQNLEKSDERECNLKNLKEDIEVCENDENYKPTRWWGGTRR
jgi:hypothetical protein